MAKKTVFSRLLFFLQARKSRRLKKTSGSRRRGFYEMKALEEKILKEGQVLPGNVLKVGSFLNQQVDAVFLKEMAKETRRLFSGERITKVLTVEASGIAFATAVAMELGVPMVFAKKHPSANVSGEQYSAAVFLHAQTNLQRGGNERLSFFCRQSAYYRRFSCRRKRFERVNRYSESGGRRGCGVLRGD